MQGRRHGFHVLDEAGHLVACGVGEADILEPGPGGVQRFSRKIHRYQAGSRHLDVLQLRPFDKGGGAQAERAEAQKSGEMSGTHEIQEHGLGQGWFHGDGSVQSSGGAWLAALVVPAKNLW